MCQPRPEVGLATRLPVKMRHVAVFAVLPLPPIGDCPVAWKNPHVVIGVPVHEMRWKLPSDCPSLREEQLPSNGAKRRAGRQVVGAYAKPYRSPQEGGYGTLVPYPAGPFAHCEMLASAKPGPKGDVDHTWDEGPIDKWRDM